jgi:cyclophilin family peptidyl-prolyl cis-trans isomerase
MLALQAANAADTAVVRRVSGDPDPRVRRLAMRVVRGAPGASVVQLARAGLSDSAAIVRIDAARLLLLARSPEGCELARRALDDASPHVRLEGIDAVAAACGAEAATALLDSLVRLLPADTAAAATSWHSAARALVALARSAPTLATPHFAYFRMHPVWQVRASLGAAARAIGDTAVLLDLLGDGDANVREETITHLATLTPTLRERAARAGLGDSSYQVVLAAAHAADSIAAIDVQTLAAALRRLTFRGQETSRDPRLALLDRIAQRGSVRDSAVLRPYVSDFDTLIARRAAALLTQWTGTPVTESPRPARPGPTPSRSARAAELRITMSPSAGGGRILVRLLPEEAPATIARVVNLALAGYYNGRTFHRVVANFVIQGGSPDANEYVGDGPFMRDELGLRSHTRGTLGISTRGRDTGDAQIFVNLVDNFRLDHDYTVFAEVVQGMDVVDRLLAGAVLQRVEVVER